MPGKNLIKSVTQSTVLSNCTPGFKINYTNQVKMTQNKYILLLKENHTKINCLHSCFTRQNITNIEFQTPKGL